MKINRISLPIIPNSNNYTNAKSVGSSNPALNTNDVIKDVRTPYYVSNIAFRGKELTEEDYDKAIGYIKSVNKYYKNSGETNFWYIGDLDLDRLNGIQKGIGVFKGLSMKEIVFALNSPCIAVHRYCSNKCAHCYVNALPENKRGDTLDRMSWEDFMNLNDGVRELRERIDNPRISMVYWNFPNNPSISPFHDSDCAELKMHDKDGKDYNFTDAANELFKAFGVEVLFDTAGWNLDDKESQKRAEKIAEYFSKEENMKKLDSFNISIHPFHYLLDDSLKFKKAGDEEMAQESREQYTDRMANVLFTFTPVLKCSLDGGKKFNLMMRAFDDKHDGCDEEFKRDELEKILKEILEKLECLYEKDLLSEKKYISESRQIAECLFYLKITNYVSTKISPRGRGQKFFKHGESKYIYNADKVIRGIKHPTGVESRILDTNGKVYNSPEDGVTMETEIKLNFDPENQKRKTRPFVGKDDHVITKAMIKEAFG